MRSGRLHITGASGTGTTTLGRAIADAWAVRHADTDDYFWEPTDPPYIRKRAGADRLRLMHAVFLPRRGWVLSGSLMGWGDPLIEHFDAVIFLTLDSTTRLARLEARERQRHAASNTPGGRQDAAHREFLDWARSYDDPGFTGRSRVRHEQWLAALACPVLRLDGAQPVSTLLAAVSAWEPG